MILASMGTLKTKILREDGSKRPLRKARQGESKLCCPSKIITNASLILILFIVYSLTRAAHNLACSYRDGEGGPVDKVMAAKYFRMAAEKGHVQAMTCLGIAYMTGDGVDDLDLDEAKKWLKRGANAGDELAVQQLEMLDMMSKMSSMGSNFSCSSNPGSMMFSFGK